MGPPPLITPAQKSAAKVAGALYLLQMAAAIFGETYVRGSMIVYGEAAATADNIKASSTLFRFGIAADLVTTLSVVILVWALYVILEPVHRNLTLLAAWLRLVENAILGTAACSLFAILALLSGADYLKAVDHSELEALAYTLIRVHGAGFRIAFVFLGAGSTAFSYVWWKSRYIPRAIAGWGIFSSLLLALVTLAIMVFPATGDAIGLMYMVPMFFYEVGLGLWLLTKGLHQPSGGDWSGGA
jgi:hypothetical protein